MERNCLSLNGVETISRYQILDQLNISKDSHATLDYDKLLISSRFLYRIRVLNRLKTKTRIGFPGKPKTGLLTDEVSLVNFWNSQYREPTDAGDLGIDKCVLYAQMAEQVDASASKADVFGVRVRVSLWAPCRFPVLESVSLKQAIG